MLSMILLVPLAGCWDRQELNEMSIVAGLGIDRVGDAYHISVQIVNPAEVSPKSSYGSKLAPVVTLEQDGKTLPDALGRLTVLTPRRLQFSHLRMVVFGESTAREGLRKPLDYLSRYAEMRNDFFLVVAKNRRASDILKMYSSMDPIPANNLFTKLRNSDEQWAATSKMTLNELLIATETEGMSAFMTGIEIVGDPGNANEKNHQEISPSSNLEYSGTAIFKRDRMVGWLDENGTKALNYVHDSIKWTVGYLGCPDKGRASVELFNIHSKIKIRGKSKGDLAVHVYLTMEQDISDVECDLDMMNEATMKWFDRQTDAKVRRIVQNTVANTKKNLRIDVFGFGQQVHRQHPKIWHRIKDWNATYLDVPVHVHVRTNTRRIGTTQQPVTRQTEKGE
ncbi:Ger(x)C family spore germination protein [Paenibacillus glycinis]|uniref:Ger(X)C family spore germination protein n=1 Tax=Paenibacillus glycinis TaxID=2697035 RepID=A0ABW9XYE4_9BACL|nr:Ger(x)C family spore germination protein [Paenibacillus glycinis]NBD27740.1 Ger(x)C family spore germination protein [Paenibacillus glycinis]